MEKKTWGHEIWRRKHGAMKYSNMVYRNAMRARLMVVMVLHLNQNPENLYIHFRESFGGYIYK